MIKRSICRITIFIVNAFHIDRFISDELYLRMLYWRVFNKKLDLDNPQSYNEKLQWLKLNNRNPLYTTLVDKFEVKKYVAEKIGEKYVIPTLGVWDNYDDIDFAMLPDQFVLKCTHDSGGVVICKDKTLFDKGKARRKINKSLKTNYFWLGREWPYKDVIPRIIAEPYIIDPGTGELPDYKFYGFDGKVKAMMLATERQSGEIKFDFFDMDFKRLPFRWGHDHSMKDLAKPAGFDEMKRLASLLSEGFPHVRIDLYDVEGQIYFGEMTFTHWSGFCPFEPEEWDYEFGSWIELPR